MTYTAVIDVDNRSGRLAPGQTAVVMVHAAERRNVTRVPNIALTFRPSSDVLARTRQDGLAMAPPRAAGSGAPGAPSYVWRFENGRFVPVLIRTGLADDYWTEVLSGDVQPGDRLITSAKALTRAPARRRARSR